MKIIFQTIILLMVLTDCLKAQQTICTEAVNGESFSWDYAEGQFPNWTPVTHTINQPATDYGYVFDIYSLDNTFNMNINGVQLTTQELQFQINIDELPTNIRFKSDGELWNGTTIPAIYQLTGNPSNPLIRVTISASGEVMIYGSRTIDSGLEELELYNGNSFNTITWNTSAPNNVVVSQLVYGRTVMSGQGYGLNIVPFMTHPGDFSENGLPTKVGISTLNSQVNGWPESIPNGWITLESK